MNCESLLWIEYAGTEYHFPKFILIHVRVIFIRIIVQRQWFMSKKGEGGMLFGVWFPSIKLEIIFAYTCILGKISPSLRTVLCNPHNSSVVSVEINIIKYIKQVHSVFVDVAPN